jgi:hypothetical protein
MYLLIWWSLKVALSGQLFRNICIKLPFIIKRVVQIMSIIFQTGHELLIVLGNESTSASARVRFPSTIE